MLEIAVLTKILSANHCGISITHKAVLLLIATAVFEEPLKTIFNSLPFNEAFVYPQSKPSIAEGVNGISKNLLWPWASSIFSKILSPSADSTADSAKSSTCFSSSDWSSNGPSIILLKMVHLMQLYVIPVL